MMTDEGPMRLTMASSLPLPLPAPSPARMHREAEALLRSALEIRLAVLGAGHPLVGRTQLALAAALARQQAHKDPDQLCKLGMLVGRSHAHTGP